MSWGLYVGIGWFQFHFVWWYPYVNLPRAATPLALPVEVYSLRIIYSDAISACIVFCGGRHVVEFKPMPTGRFLHGSYQTR